MALSRRGFIALSTASCGFAAMPRLARALIASQTRVLHPVPLILLPGEKAWEILEASAADDAARHALQGRHVTLTGYLKRLGPHEALLSRMPYHCDYCYLGKPGSQIRLQQQAGDWPDSSQPVSVQGILKLSAGRDACYAFIRAVRLPA